MVFWSKALSLPTALYKVSEFNLNRNIWYPSTGEMQIAPLNVLIKRDMDAGYKASRWWNNGGYRLIRRIRDRIIGAAEKQCMGYSIPLRIRKSLISSYIGLE